VNRASESEVDVQRDHREITNDHRIVVEDSGCDPMLEKTRTCYDAVVTARIAQSIDVAVRDDDPEEDHDQHGTRIERADRHEERGNHMSEKSERCLSWT